LELSPIIATHIPLQVNLHIIALGIFRIGTRYCIWPVCCGNGWNHTIASQQNHFHRQCTAAGPTSLY